jgi:hypothetical protein
LGVDLGVAGDLGEQAGDGGLFGDDVVAEVGEDAVGWDLTEQLHRQPIVQEDVDAGS